jgi:tartrate dehydratase alpha subunit/fumarate hydratase class I-like protein
MSRETKKIAKQKANFLTLTFGKHLALECIKECCFYCQNTGTMIFLIEVEKQINLIKQSK